MLTVAQGYAFDIERGPDWLLVRVRNVGAPNTETPPLAERLWTLLQQHLTHRLVLELDQVASLDENMLGQLAQLGRRIEQHDGVLRLCGLSPRNREQCMLAVWTNTSCPIKIGLKPSPAACIRDKRSRLLPPDDSCHRRQEAFYCAHLTHSSYFSLSSRPRSSARRYGFCVKRRILAVKWTVPFLLTQKSDSPQVPPPDQPIR